MSYILRHNPMHLKMDKEGFVDIDKFLEIVQTKYNWIKKKDLYSIAQKNERYEIKNDQIRAVYGHTINVSFQLNGVKIDKLYHGTSKETAEKILKEGLKPMRRKKVHLSKTIKDAVTVGKRKTKNPVILEIDASSAIKNIALDILLPTFYLKIASIFPDKNI